MAKNFWENDDLVQPSQPSKTPWEADDIITPAAKKNFGEQLLDGQVPDIFKTKQSVLEGTKLTPQDLATPPTGPALADAISQIKDRDPETYLRAAKKAELEEKTRQYEEDVPFLKRQTDPIMSGVKTIPANLYNLEVISLQKEIDKIRSGKTGPRDPNTGEVIPFSLEDSDAAIQNIQARQAEALKKVMDAQADASQYRKRPVVEAIGKVKTAREAFDAFQVDPFGAMASVSLESAPQMVPALVLGAVTRSPMAGALAMGSTSFGSELASGVTEYFQDNGVNIKDPIAVNKALNDPVMFQKAYNHAITRASIIGTLDTASAGLASKLLVPKQVIKSQTAREALNIGVAQPAAQMISGAGGEALAQVATEGSVTKPGQVFLEAIGEGPTSILETAAFGGEKAIQRFKDQRNQAPDTITPVIVPEGMDPELHARASMRLEQLIAQGEEQGVVNKRELNKLARELDIKPSKNVDDTASAIYNALTPTQEQPAPEATFQPPVEDEIVAPAQAPVISQEQAKFKESEFQEPIEPPQPKAPEITKPEIVQSFPMGENSEFQVIKNDQGYVTNLYDKDAGQYLDTMRLFPTEKFGEEAESRAIEFARSESEKAAALTPKATEVVKEEEVKVAPKAIELTNTKEGFIASKDGKPITLYHTTRAVDENGNQIKDLIPGGPKGDGSGKAIWFGIDPNKLQAAHNAPVGKEGSYTIPSYVKLENPLYIDDFNYQEMRDRWGPDLPFSISNERIEKLKSAGYDGIIYEDNGQIEEVVVFNKDQVTFKSDYKPEAPAAAPVEPVKTQAQINQERQAAQREAAALETKPVEKPKVEVSENKVFTDDAAEKARALLKSKLNQLNSGIDPEVLQAGIVLSGYHVEKGARTFAAYSAAMIKDLGDAVKPYLKSWYMALKYDPRSTEFKDEMDSADSVDKFQYETKSDYPDLLTPEGKFEIAQRVSFALSAGAKYENIAAARQFIKGIVGRTINPGTAEAKEADEAIEVGVVLAARDIVSEGNSPEETYNKLVDLYDRQPNLNVRSSESIAQQAYSTPAPLAYIASQLAGIDKKTTVLEPTAGNGMLLIGADPKKVMANELNATRLEMLKRLLPGAEIDNRNAAFEFMPVDQSSMDVVIANPPFGAFKDKEGAQLKQDGGSNLNYKKSSTALPYESGEIDHVISFMALNKMKDDGRAVLIVGGVRAKDDEAKREGYRGKAKRQFYSFLYNDYNVVDHFTVDGDLYKKQGAGYPVDVIVINGKGKSQRDLPAADLPKVYSSYEQLKEKLDEASRMESRDVSAPGVDRGVSTTRTGEPQDVGRGTVRESDRVSDEGREPAEGKRPSVPEAGTTTGRGEPTGGKPSDQQPRPTDESKRSADKEQLVPSGSTGVEPRTVRSTKETKPVELGGSSVVAGERVESRLKDRRGEETETATQVAYEPHSQASSVGTLVPKAMRDAIDESLAKIEDEMGSIDQYVANSLKMDVSDLETSFSAEQVDALALAIRNAEAGKGFIIGDQTGIGKGRVVAAMIKYSLVNGKVPIFVTEKPNLYSDMIRDLDDIGMTNELALDTAKPKIFITNSSEAIPYQLLRTDKNGEVTETNLTIKAPKSGKALEEMMKQMITKDSLGDYKVIFTTYSQLQTIKGKVPERGKFIQNFGEGNYMIFDESHNAGGGAATRDSDDMTRAKFVRELVQNAFGTFFSSATYAKRPDVMDLYSSTDMSLAVESPSELGDAIKLGGVPMQQIVATMLTRVGQYIRRERTFAGVAYDTRETKVDKQTAENMASAMRSVLAFSRSKESVIKGIQKEFDKEGKVAKEFGGESKTIQGANFGSVMHNLIDQMLLSLKAQDSVNHAIERLKAGEKVVMTVSNTMGSFLQSYAEDMGIEVGGEVDLSFADLYVRYLDKQRMVTIRGPEGKVLHRLTDEELGPTLTAQYESVKKQILESGFGSAPISPIDYMHNELRKAGFKTDEITGRTVTLNYAGGTPILQTRTANIKQRVGAVRGFNNGEVDVLILNQAGSTGLSLHAAEKFKDKRKRHMIIVQPEKNIDTHMQMLGRVHRTGQVIAPAYSQMMADIPAEMRPAAVLMKKMASLNANTTASRKSAVTAEGVVDFINEYGGQIVQEYLKDSPEVLEAIGGEKVVGLKEDATEGVEEDIRKFTGYIPILPIAQQAEIYRDLTERYNELIERENSLGTNKLEAKALDLDAETLSVQPVTEDKGDPSIFASPAIMERVDVKRTVKPYSSEEVKEQIEKSLDGKSKSDVAVEQSASLLERFREFATKQLDKAKEAESDEVKIQSIKDNLRTMHSKIKVILDTYKIGDEISIKDAAGIYNYAVITDITNSKKTANPAAGSDWKMHIALANGDAKALTISFSQINTTYTLSRESYVDYFNPETQQAERVKVMDIFDKGATVRREKRWMVTGNILAGFAKFPGQIVTYTKNDGTTGQGVLMSRQFDFEKAQKEAPVRIKSGGQAMRFFEEIGGVISTDDNNMRIERSGRSYHFFTPKPKRQGGMYYGDEVLTQYTGTFYSSGGTMRAVVYDEAKAEQAIQHLIDTNKKLLVKTGVEKARALFNPPKLENIEEKQLTDMAVQDRKDTIKEYSRVRKAGRRLIKQVAKYGSDIPMQRQLNEVLAQEENLKNYIDQTKVSAMTAEDFMARATEELAAGNITPEVERFVRSVYEQYPNILNGIKLSVRAKEGKGRATGNFDPIERLITLWKGTSGVLTSKTVSHELTHTMEQMMTPEQRKAVIGAWARSLEAAMKKHKDAQSQKYFEQVLKFLENPSEQTAKDATNVMPDYSFYQYLNPSEYWAVNAEKMFGQQLGGAWTRFVKAMEKLFEALKSMFFMNNKLAVHRAFDQIIKKQPTRETRQTLVDYLSGAKIPTRFLNQIEEDKNLVEDLGIPDVPNRDSQTKKDYILEKVSKINEKAKEVKVDPKESMQDGLAVAYDAATMARIKNVDYTAGLAKRDMANWEGQIRTANGEMIPVVAALNNLRSGHLANAVLVHGKLEYSGKYGQFIAVDSEESMGNVIRLQERLRRRLTKNVADKLINGWFIATRTRSIQDEYFKRTASVRALQEAFMAAEQSKKEEIGLLLQEAQQDLANIKLAYQKVPYYFTIYNGFITKKIKGKEVRMPDVQYDQDGLPILNDIALDSIIARSDAHPELQMMMDNWTAVNHNMLDNLAFSGRESKPYVEKLKKIKNYSPWSRVMEESHNPYDAKQISTGSSGPRHFKAGRTERDVDNVVESMMHNVAMFTRSTLKNYAQYRIAMEYAERAPETFDSKTGKPKRGRILVFSGEPRSDAEGAKLPLYIGGRKMLINIPDNLVAEAYIGMSIDPYKFPGRDVLAAAAQLSRRSITFSGVFQLKQVFYDSWAAALKSGSKHPWRLWGATYIGFFRALEIGKQDKTVQILRRAAIGGFRSHYRSPELELKVEVGLLTNNNWQTLMSSIDAIGDASDYSTRVATYDRLLKESGDPALALFMSSNIMDFSKHGKGMIGQTMRTTVTFMQAWATDLDTMSQTAMGGAITGKAKKDLRKQFRRTMLNFMVLAIVYTLIASLDPDYDELDDSTKARNFYVPFSKQATGAHVLIPLNNTAAFFFKVTPEMIMNYARKYGTEEHIDTTRAVDAWLKAMVDSVLGPTPIPTGIKPSLEIFLDRNTFTGGTVVPKSLKDLDSAEQYTAATSELAKILGEYTGISPVKTDHFIRGTFGTLGGLAQWFSNIIFSEGRVASELKQNPIVSSFVAPDVLKLNEQLYYDLKDKTTKAFETWEDLLKNEKFEKADAWYEKNEKLIEAHAYVTSIEEELKELNKEIRRIGRTYDKSMSPDEKRAEINDFTKTKQDLLSGIFEIRRDAGL